MRVISGNLRPSRSSHYFGVIAIVGGFLLSGCVTYSEKYFIEVEECRPGWKAPHSSFLKLDLVGQTSFTTSKFEMGWYDRRGVDSLFSTMSPTNQNDVRPTTPDLSTSAANEEMGMDCTKGPSDERLWRRTRVYGPNGKVIGDVAGKRLVIFAASNPSDLVNRISTTANTLAMSEQVAGQLRRPEMEEVARVDLKVDLAGRRHESLAVEALELLRWLETQSAGAVKNDLLKAKLKGLSEHAAATTEQR